MGNAEASIMPELTKAQIVEALKEFLKRKAFIIGNELQNKVQGKISDMRLVSDKKTGKTGKTGLRGNYLNSFSMAVSEEGDNIVITLTSTAPYAPYLEYGTYDYWKEYGLESFPSFQDPKKKDLAAGLRKQYPKGMQPFAPIRRSMAEMPKVIKQVIT